jgi:hypothetical protein
VLVRVGALGEAVEVREDVVLAFEAFAVVGDEDRDLVALVRIRRHLARDEVEPELGQSLPDEVRMRTPFGLVQLHDTTFASGARGQTAAVGIVRKMDRGRDEATPFYLLGGVTLGIGIVVAIVVAVALILYYVFGGK